MFDSAKKEASKKYLADIKKRSTSVFGEEKQIINAFLACYNEDGYSYNGIENEDEFYNLLWSTGTNKISNIFSGSMHQVLDILLGGEWGEKFKKIWDKCTTYIYSRGFDRRSFRTKINDKLYLSTNISKLKSMVELLANDFSYEKYFSKKSKMFADNLIIPDLLALEIDEGNENVLKWIYDIIYGDNNTGFITRELIKGVLMSKNSTAHKWVGDLLLAGKLQEGLRQAIVECMDEGSREGFLHILKIILDHNLSRFSSIVRALDVWTGLCIFAEKPKVIKKCFETAYKCLTESDYVDECLKSDDAMLIFIGLWSIAFDEVMVTEKEIRILLTAKEKYKRLVALCFLKQMQVPIFQHTLAFPLLDDPDYEIKSWALVNIFSDLTDFTYRSIFTDDLAKYRQIKVYSQEDMFDKLKNVLDNMPKKEIVFTGSIFPWWNASISYDEIILKLLLIIALDRSENKVDMMLDYCHKMSADTRLLFIKSFLNNPKTDKQKTTLVELMGDRSIYVREGALKYINKLTLSEKDYRIIEDLLRYKSGDLRKNAIAVLLCQSPEALLMSIKRLIADGSEQKILAVLDMIAAVEKEPKFHVISQECHNMAAVISKTAQQRVVSQKTKELAERITNTDIHQFTAVNGFGLYDPLKEIPLPQITCLKEFSAKSILSSSLEEVRNILLKFSNLVDKYKDYEYEVMRGDGSCHKVVLGSQWNFIYISRPKDGVLTLDDYPLTEVWREAAKEVKLAERILLEILFYNSNTNDYGTKQDWYVELMFKLFNIDKKNVEESLKNIPYLSYVYRIFTALLNEFPKAKVFQLCYDMLSYIYCTTPAQCFLEDCEKRDSRYDFELKYRTLLVDAPEIAFWYDKMSKTIYDEESFKKAFKVKYALYKASGYKTHQCISLGDFEKAFALGLVDENELYKELSARPLSSEHLRKLTDVRPFQNNDVVSYQKLNEVCKNVVNRVLEIELKRGDMVTEVSHLAAKIYRCTGTRFFVDILVGLEKDTYVRGYNFVADNSTKKEIFSHLIKYCYPGEGEDENTLRDLLKDRKVTEKQLIDAAMYAPQWVDIVEKYLNWEGLKSACWYFHAHVNQVLSSAESIIVAKFSPVSSLDFFAGAFDINWFKEAYETLGEKRFQVVYDSAKYIAGGGLHKRAQLFADTVLGKISIEQAESIITEKRNKDYVLCYGLIPLSKDKKDMLHRYEFLYNFLSESKQFGAQRRESEAKVVNISLENLSRNAGFSDVVRFTWYMEIEKIHEIEQYLKPVTIEGVEIYISIDETGKPAIIVSKNGKEYKSIPTALKKHAYIKVIKEVQKSLNDQRIRARQILEKAMELGDEFTVNELQSLSKNPVIYPLIQNLIFKRNNLLGFYKNNALIDIEGCTYGMDQADCCTIAHSIHLYESGEWAAYQKDLYDRQIIQPFKQAFRELYRPNNDELETRVISNRYAGYQIQPNKAVALLMSRGWTVSYEEGLQKIYYKANIIAQLFARADWFTPSDVETPTLECIQFFDRITGKPVAFGDVPKIIFSEIMRDVDLVVSVAHVGGVDPEASLSTIEMRIAIITEMLRLLKLVNVELKGSHAFIKGTLGQYTVHLGSGVVHKMAKGAINIISVHSQHRGRIFLPFVDDDPRTSEILSKIIYLAEDHKIKDPTVLEQIVE